MAFGNALLLNPPVQIPDLAFPAALTVTEQTIDISGFTRRQQVI